MSGKSLSNKSNHESTKTNSSNTGALYLLPHLAAQSICTCLCFSHLIIHGDIFSCREIIQSQRKQQPNIPSGHCQGHLSTRIHSRRRDHTGSPISAAIQRDRVTGCYYDQNSNHLGRIGAVSEGFLIPYRPHCCDSTFSLIQGSQGWEGPLDDVAHPPPATDEQVKPGES